MERYKTPGIILRRTNYAEADKVVSLITKDFGRISVLARGVRKIASKMAGGIEPFTVSSIEFIKGKGNLDTLVSARSKTSFDGLVADYERTVLAGELLKTMDQLIEDDVDEQFFNLASELLSSLNETDIDEEVVDVWFRLNLLGLLGREPNLLKDTDSKKLDEKSTYHFDEQEGRFRKSEQGSFKVNQIKAWRVLSLKSPRQARAVKGINKATEGTSSQLKMFMEENSF